MCLCVGMGDVGCVVVMLRAGFLWEYDAFVCGDGGCRVRVRGCDA